VGDGDHLEIEQKYEADAGFVVPPLDGLPGVAQVSAPVVYRLDATYYDTASLALIGNKVTLRRRTGGPDEGWHLKLPVQKEVRRELHEPLGSATDVPLRLSSQVADLMAGQPLHPIALLATERTVRRLFDEAGSLLAEVADDQVTATRLDPDGGAATTPLIWREIEVEAGDTGTSEFLAAAGRLLREAGAQPARSASKLARVLA
jgi:inorganic triphosphatase YgiF